MSDRDEIETTLQSARGTVNEQGIDVREVTFVKEAIAPAEIPPAPDAPHFNDLDGLIHRDGQSGPLTASTVKLLAWLKRRRPITYDAVNPKSRTTEKLASGKLDEAVKDLASAVRATGLDGDRGKAAKHVTAFLRDRANAQHSELWMLAWAAVHAPSPKAAKAAAIVAEDDRPRVQSSSDHFETYRLFADALVERNKRDPKHPATVLNAAGKLCRVGTDGTTPLDKFGITYHLSSLLRPFVYRKNQEDEVETVDANVPREVVELFLGAGPEDHRKNFVTVEKASNKPCIDPTTGEVTRSGYDAATRTFVRLAADMLYEMPEGPAAEQLAAAVAFVRELLHDFCWSSPVDFANAVAMLLTGAISGSWGGILTPLFGIDGPMQGSGKSLLAWLGAASAGVVDEASVSGRQKGTEAEFDKTLASAWSKGGLVVVFDNIEDKLDSGDLTRACTELRTSVRLLGGGTITICCNILKVVTGNNLTYSADLAKRVIRIYLDPRRPDPENRSGWRIGGVDELKAHVRQNLGKLIASLHIMVLAWIQAGRQEYEGVRTHGRFPDWSKVVGNVLAHAGIHGFLANKDAVAAADDETTDARRILAAVKAKADQLQASTFQTADIAKYLNAEVRQLVLDGKHPDRLNVLLGRWLGKHVNTPVVIDNATWTLQSPGEDRVGTRLYQFERQQS